MSFRSFRLLSAIAVPAILAATSSVGGQTHAMHLGPRASYQFDLEELGVGAQFSAPIGTYLEFYPSLDVFFVDRGSATNLNVDLKYRLGNRSSDWLYVGGGLNLARRSHGDDSHTDAGLNIFVGAESLRGRVHPFGEFRFTANNGSTGQLSVGLNFTL